MSFSGVPSRRCPAATIASPLVHTVTAANAEGDGQCQPRADEPAADAEERAAGHGHVGAGARPDDRRGQHRQRADRGADGHRRHRLPEAQAEQDREGAEDDVRPGQVGAEEDRGEIAWSGVAGVFGQVLDACGFDRADAVLGRLRQGARASVAVMSCSIRLVDGYINSVDVVFNKNRDSSIGGCEIDRRSVRDAKRKLPAERHGELLAKAVEISAAEGLSAVTLRRVATDLGVTPGLVSHYFSSAEQLITAAFCTAADRRSGRGAGARGRRGDADRQDGRADGLRARRVQ